MPQSATIAALRTLVAARFPSTPRKRASGVATGIAAIDEALGGGLPTGKLTEVVSAEPSSGGQTLLGQLLASTRAARKRIVLIDGADGFSPEAVPPDNLRHLVWVRCTNLAQAFASADVVVRDGNFSVVVVDLRGCDPRALSKTPATSWYRLHRAAEAGEVAVLVQTAHPCVPAVPARLVLTAAQGLAVRGFARTALAAQLSLEISRGHADRADEEKSA